MNDEAPSVRNQLRPAAQRLTPQDVVVALSEVLRDVGSLTTHVGGTVAFEILGGVGLRWVVDLGVAGGAWTTGDLKADTTVSCSSEAFGAMLLSPNALGGYMREGELRVSGDRTKLAHLGRFLRGGQTVLRCRMANS